MTIHTFKLAPALRLLAAALMLLPASGPQAAMKAPPLPAVQSSAQWIKAGQPQQLTVAQFGGDAFLAVDDLARLSESHVRWQAAANLACLANSNGEMCLDWTAGKVAFDGRRVRRSVRMRHDGNTLFVPMSFVVSREFSKFASADLSWNAGKARLVHDPHVNLRVPQVEKVDGLYRIALAVNPLSPPQLIEQSDRQIWLRFPRAVTGGSQIFEGDTVIDEVRVNQKRRSADFIVRLGENAGESEVYFDDGRRRLVIDVMPRRAVPSTASSPVASAPVRRKDAGKPLSIVSKPAVVPPVPLPIARVAERARAAVPRTKGAERVFVIDAGHGGRDSGAIGVRGTLEKDVNLTVARMLARELKKQKGVKVIMTRSKDVFVPLADRTAAANAANADLFISVHCNSALSSKGRGFEVYFLSPEATDKAAAAVARVENSVVALEAQKGSQSSRLEELLASMAVSNYLNESSKFAGLVTRSVKSRTSVPSAVVKEANFFVLRGAQMPSVLLELEYLSNPVSELQLRSSRFRNRIVKGVVEGIMAYDKRFLQEKEAYAAQLRRDTGRAR